MEHIPSAAVSPIAIRNGQYRWDGKIYQYHINGVHSSNDLEQTTLKPAELHAFENIIKNWIYFLDRNAELLHNAIFLWLIEKQSSVFGWKLGWIPKVSSSRLERILI